MIHRLAAALALIALGVAMPFATAPVHAARWAEGPCTDNVGITVVVDFQELGGGVNVRCAPEPATSGLDALDKAGIVWEGTRRFPGFVCRIAGKPGPDTESCGTTPPATAYWSYWVAPRGGSWCFSSLGAGSRTPPPGSIEGWSFASNRVAVDVPPPRFDPPAPIPGEAPNPLRGADCGTPASASPNPTTPPAATTIPPPVATNAPAPPAVPTTPAVLADPDSASTADDASAQQASESPTASTATPQPATNAGAVPLAPLAASTTTSIASPSTTRPRTTAAGSTDDSVTGSSDTSAGPEGSVPLGTVDLGDDGRGDSGFSPAAGLGLLTAVGVGGSSVWAAKRRRRGPP